MRNYDFDYGIPWSLFLGVGGLYPLLVRGKNEDSQSPVTP